MQSHSKDISSALNRYFTTIGIKLANKMPSTGASFSNYPSSPTQESFYFEAVMPKEVEREIIQIPNGKKYGLYSSQIHILKIIKSNISQPFSEIINLSLPTAW